MIKDFSLGDCQVWPERVRDVLCTVKSIEAEPKYTQVLKGSLILVECGTILLTLSYYIQGEI